MSEADDLRKCLADIVVASVLHPEHRGFEIVPRITLDQARMLIEREDINAATKRMPDWRRNARGEGQ